jgi:putative GTP pyrophosphokinase
MALSVSKTRVDKAGDAIRAFHAGHRCSQHELYEHLMAIRAFRSDHGQPLTRVAANLRYYVDQAAPNSRHKRIGQRLKRMPTILDKLEREPRMALSRMHDIGGCRAIVESQDGIDVIVERLRRQRRWDVRREYDYVADPKVDGYRAKHLIVRKDGVLVEIQLRTLTQHSWAELVERLDLEHGLMLKQHRADPQNVRQIAEIGSLLAQYEAREIGREELERALRRELVFAPRPHP